MASTCWSKERSARVDLLPSLGKSVPSLGCRAPACPTKGQEELPQIWDPARFLTPPDHLLGSSITLAAALHRQPTTRLAVPSSQHQPQGLLKAQFWSFPSQINIYHQQPFIFKTKVNQSSVTHKTPNPCLLWWLTCLRIPDMAPFQPEGAYNPLNPLSPALLCCPCPH